MSEEELHSSSDKEEERIHTATRPTDVRAVIARLDAAIERCRALTSPATRASMDAISSMGQRMTIVGSTAPAPPRPVPTPQRSVLPTDDGGDQLVEEEHEIERMSRVVNLAIEGLPWSEYFFQRYTRQTVDGWRETEARRPAADSSDEPYIYTGPRSLLAGRHYPHADRVEPKTRKYEEVRWAEKSHQAGQEWMAGPRRYRENFYMPMLIKRASLVYTCTILKFNTM